MKYYKTKRAAEDAAEENNYLLGQKMMPPYSSLPITSLTVEKAKKHQGFIVVLSYDVFDGGWAEITSNRCPQVELDNYLDIVAPKYL